MPRVTMVPRVPAWLLGVTNLRGDIVSVIDLRGYLGLAPHTSATARMLVVRLLDEPFTTGLIVDAVDRIVTLQADDVKAPASPFEGALAPFVSGVMVMLEPVPVEPPMPQPPSCHYHDAPVPSVPPFTVRVTFPPRQIWL